MKSYGLKLLIDVMAIFFICNFQVFHLLLCYSVVGFWLLRGQKLAIK